MFNNVTIWLILAANFFVLTWAKISIGIADSKSNVTKTVRGKNSQKTLHKIQTFCSRVHKNTDYLGIKPLFAINVSTAHDCRDLCLDLYPRCRAGVFYSIHKAEHATCYIFNKTSANIDVLLHAEKPLAVGDKIRTIEIVRDCHEFDVTPPLSEAFVVSTDKVLRKKRETEFGRPIKILGLWTVWTPCTNETRNQLRSRKCEYGRILQKRACVGDPPPGGEIPLFDPAFYPPPPYQHPSADSVDYARRLAEHREQIRKVQEACCEQQARYREHVERSHITFCRHDCPPPELQVAVGVPEKHWIDEEASKPSGSWRAEQGVPATRRQGIEIQGPDDPRRGSYGPEQYQPQPLSRQHLQSAPYYSQQIPQQAPEIPYSQRIPQNEAGYRMHGPMYPEYQYPRAGETQMNGLPEQYRQMVQPTTEYGTSEDWEARQAEGAHWEHQEQRPGEHTGWQPADQESVSWSGTPHEDSLGSAIQLSDGSAPVLLENGDDIDNDLNNAYDETQQMTYDDRVRIQETEHYRMQQTESGEIYDGSHDQRHQEGSVWDGTQKVADNRYQEDEGAPQQGYDHHYEQAATQTDEDDDEERPDYAYEEDGQEQAVEPPADTVVVGSYQPDHGFGTTSSWDSVSPAPEHSAADGQPHGWTVAASGTYPDQIHDLPVTTQTPSDYDPYYQSWTSTVEPTYQQCQPGQPCYSGQPGHPGELQQSEQDQLHHSEYPDRREHQEQPRYPSQVEYAPDRSTQQSQTPQPGYPGEPSQPEQPRYLGQPVYLGQPEPPAYPDQQGGPDQPRYPEVLSQPEHPSYPEHTGYPIEQEQPTHAGYTGEESRPEQPKYPEYPGYLGESEQTAQPSYPGYLGDQSQTEQFRYPGQAGYPIEAEDVGHPSQPEYAGESGQQEHPGYPGETEQQSQSEYREHLGRPEHSHYPRQPVQPEHPGPLDQRRQEGQFGYSSETERKAQPQYPDQPSQEGYPGETERPIEPVHPEHPSQPGRPEGSVQQPSYPGEPSQQGQAEQPRDPYKEYWSRYRAQQQSPASPTPLSNEILAGQYPYQPAQPAYPEEDQRGRDAYSEDVYGRDRAQGRPTLMAPEFQYNEPGWTTWTTWSICQVHCGDGVQTRKRVCNGGGCSGEHHQERPCHRRPCGMWVEWCDWSQCKGDKVTV